MAKNPITGAALSLSDEEFKQRIACLGPVPEGDPALSPRSSRSKAFHKTRFAKITAPSASED